MTFNCPARVLIVDDDEDFGAMLRRSLVRLGSRVSRASDLGQGLALAWGEDFDLVLLDVMLPDGNGLERVHDFRGAPASPEVIVITGQSGLEGAEAAVRAGAWDYLEKPFSQAELKLIMARALAYRRRVLQSHGPTDAWAQGLPSWNRYRAQALSRLEAQYLVQLMDKAGGDTGRAAQAAGLSVAWLKRLLKRNGLAGERKG